MKFAKKNENIPKNLLKIKYLVFFTKSNNFSSVTHNFFPELSKKNIMLQNTTQTKNIWTVISWTPFTNNKS
jgi:hypothetical protein